MTLPREVDVLVAGASFAGLGAARMLGSRALLCDRAPLGANQTSACGAPLALIERMGAAAAVLQVHRRLAIGVGPHTVTWPLPQPFCTFDYAAFCRLAFAATGAAFAQTSVQRVAGGLVHTSAGPVRARLVMDATGPRAPLRTGGPRRLAFGLETELPVAMDDTLYFYFLPEVRDGYAWAFPSGRVTRFGVLSYLGRTKVRPALDAFLRRFGLSAGPLHGGFLAAGWTDPVRGTVFAAGDAAGQCLPLTGEGIRTAVLAGETCGRLLLDVLEGALSLREGADRYRRFVARERWRYRALLWANLAVLALPRGLLRRAASAVAHRRVLVWFFGHYLGVFSPA